VNSQGIALLVLPPLRAESQKAGQFSHVETKMIKLEMIHENMQSS